MDIIHKTTILAESAKYDMSCSCNVGHFTRKRDPLNPIYKWIYPAVLPNGQTIPVLKILLTNYCVNNCKYCYICRNTRSDSVSFEPAELSKLFMQMVQKKLVMGLFLSSGSGLNVTRTMDKMIETAEILRVKYLFRGYIHLKILPGADLSHIEKALQLANRISVNLEAPNSKRLQTIAEKKSFESLLNKIKTIGSILEKKYGKSSAFHRKSQTTQLVVGAANETDKEILTTTKNLYSNFNLSRVYYSAFQPNEESSMKDTPPVPLIREHRLYQVDFLFRKYGFELKDIIFDKDENLSLENDPKTLWAMHHPEMFPIEINKADIWQLIRIPGIGHVSAKKIVNLRSKTKIRTLEELKLLGIRTKQARNYLLINGKSFSKPTQLELTFI